MSKRRVVSKRGALTRGELCSFRAGAVVSLRALVIERISSYRDGNISIPPIGGIRFVNGHRTKQTSDKAKSRAGGLAPVRRLRRRISIAPTSATRAKRIAPRPLASTTQRHQKLPKIGAKRVRVPSELNLYLCARRARLAGALPSVLSCLQTKSHYPPHALLAAGKLLAAA